jgi:hypothetical protein
LSVGVSSARTDNSNRHSTRQIAQSNSEASSEKAISSKLSVLEGLKVDVGVVDRFL